MWRNGLVRVMAEILGRIVAHNKTIVVELEGDGFGNATHLVVTNGTRRAIKVVAIGLTTESRDVAASSARTRTAVSPTLVATRDETGRAGLSLTFAPPAGGR